MDGSTPMDALIEDLEERIELHKTINEAVYAKTDDDSFAKRYERIVDKLKLGTISVEDASKEADELSALIRSGEKDSATPYSDRERLLRMASDKSAKHSGRTKDSR